MTAPAQLSLLGGFRLEVDGEPVVLRPGGQRLVALLATLGPLSRPAAARALWPDATEAHGRMRTTLWRLRSSEVVQTAEQRLALADSVSVDLRRWTDAAGWLTETGSADPAEVEFFVAGPGELLPGWYDDWVLVERERFRSTRLRALQALAENAYDHGHYAVAVTAALTAVRLEPLCEGAHRTLIRTHLAEHNVMEALRHYRVLESLLACELGVRPARHLTELLEEFSSRGLTRR
jgi:DNA-binding SARP family transcriptional activator